MPTRYRSFQVRINTIATHRYEAVLLNNPRGGDVSSLFAFPLSPEALAEAAEFGMEVPTGSAALLDVAERLGRQLFDALFQGEMLSAWRLAITQDESAGFATRLQLQLVPPELRQIPWELLYDSQYDTFLVLDERFTVVRYPEQAEAVAPLVAGRPLRILGVVSNPTDTIQLDVATEKRNLESALRPLIAENLVELVWAEQASYTDLLETLGAAQRARRPFRIFHYIGHAGFSIAKQRGVLLLEKEDGSSDPVESTQLGTMLLQRGILLAVLNACDSSRGAEADPFRSLALALVARANIPAVIANQYAISDGAAIALSQRFYEALTQGEPVEAALGAARRAVRDSVRPPEWATTVFFSRLREPLDLGLAQRDMLDRVLVQAPLFWASVVGLVSFLALVTVVSTIRQLGWWVGGALQFLIWLLAAWLVYDRWATLRQRFILAAAAAAVGALAGTAFFLWQPTVLVPIPPADVTLTLSEPPPSFFRPEDIKGVSFSTPVRGTVANVPEGWTLWLLVRADNSSTFAIGERATMGADGAFAVDELVIGPVVARELGGRLYSIQPVLADPAADAAFERLRRNDIWRYFHPDIRVRPEPRLSDTVVVRR